VIFQDFPGPGIFKIKNPGLSRRSGNPVFNARDFRTVGTGVDTGEWGVVVLYTLQYHIIEGKRTRGRQSKTFMDWISTTCGDKWNINEILKICQDCNEHLLIANVIV